MVPEFRKGILEADSGDMKEEGNILYQL